MLSVLQCSLTLSLGNKMKTSKLLVASVLMLGAVGSSFAAGKTLNSMNEKEMQATSMVAICAVANHRFSDLMTKNP
jgi:hypothetical protein